MIFKNFSAVLLLSIVLVSCRKEYDCRNVQIQPAFIGFSPSDIDTLILRRFKPNNNYQNLIDTFIVNRDFSSFQTSSDTTNVFINDATNDGKVGIVQGYDWQIFIPAKNTTVLVSNIRSEKKTGKCGGLDKVGCVCTNRNFSVQEDAQTITFSDLNYQAERYFIYITN